MKIAFYMNCVSAHQLPLAREVQRLVGVENFAYVDAGEAGQKMQAVTHVDGMRVVRKGEGETKAWLNEADVVLTGLRDLELLETRARQGKKTFYYSERWFKPVSFGRWQNVIGCGVLPGWIRMLVPSYRRMVKRFVSWANGDSMARVLAVGPWAKKDFLRMGVKEEKIVPWGYFVSPSQGWSERNAFPTKQHILKLLWVGRLLRLKRVDDVVRAVGEYVRLSRVEGMRTCPNVTLTIVGDGPEKHRLMRLAKDVNSFIGPNHDSSPLVSFVPSQPMETIREIMRTHDVFVFSSNAYEGWGAVVSEALEERMNIIGTYECGSCPTLLPQERLYHCGDWKALAHLIDKEIRGELGACSIGEWTAVGGARRLVDLARDGE